MGKLTTHVLDTANGRPGAGIKVELFALTGDTRRALKTTLTNNDGRCDQPLLEGAGAALRRSCRAALWRGRCRCALSRAATGIAVVVQHVSRQLKGTCDATGTGWRPGQAHA
jgi:hypothetical protein